jgi:predicted aldo/keto reductase-like oxidoreductase
MARETRRRDFIAIGAGLAAGASIGLGGAGEAAEVPKTPQPGAPRPEDVKLPAGGKMPMRRLGRTGVQVSLLGLGGFHIGLRDEATATRIVRTAIDHGVTFMDNCWDYNDGASQIWMGRALRDGYRQRVFLMTKIDGRTRAAAAAQIEQCLKALGTDVIDLIQVHEVIRPTDPDRVFGADGALAALLAAQKAGKIRFIGFTGHKSPEIHLKMLAAADAHHFTFYTVQMPVNVMDAHYDSFTTKVLPVARKHNMGILGMKPIGDGVLLQSHTATPVECLHYAMSLPVSLTITGCDSMRILNQALTLARNFRPMPQETMTALLSKTANAAVAGKYEKYKTSNMFDGTIHNPQYLG